MTTLQATRKMLIVDDCQAVRTLLRHLAGGLSFRSELAVNGRDALDRLINNDPRDPFQIVLVDWEMPVMNGLQLVQLLRRNRDFDALPLMFVTMLNTMDNVTRGLEAGANEFLMKPVTRESLEEKLRILGLI